MASEGTQSHLRGSRQAHGRARGSAAGGPIPGALRGAAEGWAVKSPPSPLRQDRRGVEAAQKLRLMPRQRGCAMRARKPSRDGHVSAMEEKAPSIHAAGLCRSHAGLS